MSIKQETHDIWGTSLYWGVISLRKGTELHHVYPTFEIDEKLRWGLSHILRLPWTTIGLFIGKWQTTTSGSEEEAILKALSGRDLNNSEWEKQKALETVSNNASSFDDEWKIVDILGLAN